MTTITSSARIKNEASNIDLTPMLDVVFILLIFFVVTATFLKESTLLLGGQDIPKNDTSVLTEQNILLQLTQNNSVTFNGERIDVSAVRARITQVKASNPAVSVVIKPAKDSQANFLVSLINSAKAAGINDIVVSE